MRQEIQLAKPGDEASITLQQAIAQRRTTRAYSGAPITLGELSQLLWAAQGITGPAGLRAAPSAGGQYPLHLYIAAPAVEGLLVGVYKHHAERHALVRLSDDALQSALDEAAIGDQPWMREAAAIIVVMADFGRIQAHFRAQSPRGKRGARYAGIETGALAENVHLQATALALGVVLVGGFDDDQVKAALQNPAGFEPTALICVGKPRL